MTNSTGYTISEQDIATTLQYLKETTNPEATREDAIVYLEEHKSLAHRLAHEIVEVEQGETD
ncbi:hypothetical protein KC921_01210 [Candidatus Woesebacteria bacterium]|nr:hypothetical protein [Candidatus Woesebacteria bacterium]